MTTDTKIDKVRGFDVWLLIGATNQKVHRALNHRLKEVDLSLSQHEILLAVHLKPNSTQKEVADKLLAVKSNVSTHIANLEKRGLIVRETDDVDTRVKRLSLSKKGSALVKRSFELQTELIHQMVADVSDRELKILEGLMMRAGVVLDDVLHK